jgi:hypothetical protein
MLGQPDNWDFQWGQIVGRAWADEGFKRRLLADPAAALQEHGLTPPAGVRVVVLDRADEAPAGDGVLRLVLPDKPSAEELSEDELCSVGGAVGLARCEWCRCEHCHRCGEFCCRCGCHHPPRPEDD